MPVDAPYAKIRLRVAGIGPSLGTMSVRVAPYCGWEDANTFRQLVIACSDGRLREIAFAEHVQTASNPPYDGPYATTADVAILTFRTEAKAIKVLLLAPSDIFDAGHARVDDTLTNVADLVTWLTAFLVDDDGNGVTEYLGGYRA